MKMCLILLWFLPAVAFAQSGKYVDYEFSAEKDDGYIYAIHLDSLGSLSELEVITFIDTVGHVINLTNSTDNKISNSYDFDLAIMCYQDVSYGKDVVVLFLKSCIVINTSGQKKLAAVVLPKTMVLNLSESGLRDEVYTAMLKICGY